MKTLRKDFQQILALIAAKKEDLSDCEMRQCLSISGSEVTRESFNLLIDEMNASFQGELVLNANGDRFTVEHRDADFLKWILGKQGGRPYAYIADGHELLGRWSVAELHELMSDPERFERIAASPLPYWMKNGAIHLLNAFQERYRTHHESASRSEKVSVSEPLISAIDSLATLQKYAADHKSEAIESVVRKSLPHLAKCLGACEPTFSNDHDYAHKPPLLKERSELIGREKILTLFSESYATSHLALVLRWIVRTRFLDWEWVVDQMLAKDDYVIRYAVAEGEAERFIQMTSSSTNEGSSIGVMKRDSNEQQLTAIGKLRDLLRSPDINRQEMGCYAVVSLAETFLLSGERQDRLGVDGVVDICSLIYEIAAMRYYFARSALGDMLIRLWARGDSGVNAIQELSKNGKLDAVWNCLWEHTQLDTDFLCGVGVHPPQSRPDSMVKQIGIAPYPTQIKRAQSAMRMLRVENEELYNHLVQRFRVIGCDPKSDEVEIGEFNEDAGRELSTWIGAQYSKGQSERVQELVEILFLQPLWFTIEDVASELTELATLDDRMSVRITALVRNMIKQREKHDWWIDYGVAESAYLLRPIEAQMGSSDGESHDRLFDFAVQCFHSHGVSRVRADCAENFVADLLEVWGLGKQSSTGEYLDGPWVARLCDAGWTAVIDRLLQDSDCWVLEHVYRLFRLLHDIRSKSMNGDETLFGRWLNDRLATLQRHDAGDERCILSLVQSRSEQLGRMYWCELPRREFLESIEDAKQELTQSADWEV